MAQASREKRIETSVERRSINNYNLINDINRLERNPVPQREVFVERVVTPNVQRVERVAPGNPTVPYVKENLLRMYDVRALNEFNDAAFRDAMSALERIEEEDASKFSALLG